MIRGAAIKLERVCLVIASQAPIVPQAPGSEGLGGDARLELADGNHLACLQVGERVLGSQENHVVPSIGVSIVLEDVAIRPAPTSAGIGWQYVHAACCSCTVSAHSGVVCSCELGRHPSIPSTMRADNSSECSLKIQSVT